MDSLVLIVCIGILALLGWHGYRMGIVRVLFNILVLVLSVTISGFLVKPISAFVKDNTSLYENVEKSVMDVIHEHNFADAGTIEEFVEELPFPEYILEAAEEQIRPVSSTEAIEEIAGEVIASKIFNAIIYVAIIIIVYVVLAVVVGALNIITMLPVIKEVNKLAGLLAGLVCGVIILWLLCLMIQACGSESWAQEIFVQINGNKFLSFIYNNNLIVNVLNKYI